MRACDDLKCGVAWTRPEGVRNSEHQHSLVKAQGGHVAPCISPMQINREDPDKSPSLPGAQSTCWPQMLCAPPIVLQDRSEKTPVCAWTSFRLEAMRSFSKCLARHACLEVMKQCVNLCEKAKEEKELTEWKHESYHERPNLEISPRRSFALVRKIDARLQEQCSSRCCAASVVEEMRAPVVLVGQA